MISPQVKQIYEYVFYHLIDSFTLYQVHLILVCQIPNLEFVSEIYTVSDTR